jgi:hypothetical protein
MQSMVMTMTYFPDQPTSENELSARASLWHRGRPGAGDRRTSFLFWLTVLGLGCAALLCVTWGASSVLAKKGSEKLLRVDLLLPKLKSIHGAQKADAFRMSEPEPSELAHPKERQAPYQAQLLPTVIDHPRGTIRETPDHGVSPQATTEPPRFVSSDAGLHLIPQVDLTPPSMFETCSDPVIFIQQCTPQRGDSPMIRNWKALTMYSLLSAATVFVAPPPALAQEPKKDALEEVQRSLKDIADRLDKIEKKKSPQGDKAAIAEILRAELKKLEDGTLARLNDKVEEVKKTLDGVETKVSALQEKQLKHELKLEQHKFLIDQLIKKLDAPTSPTVDKAMLETLNAIRDSIAKLAPTEKRLMMSSPNGAAASVGRVVLMNLYSEDLLFEVNGVGYRVPAGKSRPVNNVPAGAVRYVVHSTRWGTLEDKTTTIVPGDTFTLTAR